MAKNYWWLWIGIIIIGIFVLVNQTQKTDLDKFAVIGTQNWFPNSCSYFLSQYSSTLFKCTQFIVTSNGVRQEINCPNILYYWQKDAKTRVCITSMTDELVPKYKNCKTDYECRMTITGFDGVCKNYNCQQKYCKIVYNTC